MPTHADREAYCPRCGSRLGPASADPPVCGGCGLVQWRDPKLAAGVLVARAGRVLLVQRNHEPGLGLWSFPSGFVDRGEVVEAAAAREAFEEAGVAVTIGRLIGVFSAPGNPVVFVVYEASTDDDPVPGPEALAAAFFDPASLPPLAFEHDAGIIARWADPASNPGSPLPTSPS